MEAHVIPPRNPATHMLGIDVGQRNDYSALVVAQRTVIQGPFDPATMSRPWHPQFVYQHAERIPLNTNLVTVARIIQDTTRQLASIPGAGVRLAIDATGVGAGLVDILKCLELNATLWAVFITGSNKPHAVTKSSDGYFTQSKSGLMLNVRLGLDQNRTFFAKDMKNRRLLIDELCGWGADSPTKNDDLACAAALAQWASLMAYPGDLRRSLLQAGTVVR